MASSWQKVLGLFLTVLAVVVFIYYAIWVIALPFVDADHPIQNFFPHRRFALLIPSILGVLGIGVLGIVVSVVLLRERWGLDGTANKKSKKVK